MEEYEYNFDNDSFEIFPHGLCNDPLVVFHGTSTYHSANIEQHGLVINTTPFDIEKAKILVDTLKLAEIRKFDIKSGFFNWTIADSLVHYIDAIEHEDFKLSFSCLSSSCLQFTSNENKGGQAFGHIRNAKVIIEKALAENPEISQLIPLDVLDLFNEIDRVNNSEGIVYAIKLPRELDCIELNTNVIYSNQSIPLASIVAKVRIPENVDLNFLAIKDKMKRKLQSGIGRVLWSKMDLEDDLNNESAGL